MLSYLGPHREHTRVLPITIYLYVLMDVGHIFIISRYVFISSVQLLQTFVLKNIGIEWCIFIAPFYQGVVN